MDTTGTIKKSKQSWILREFGDYTSFILLCGWLVLPLIFFIAMFSAAYYKSYIFDIREACKGDLLSERHSIHTMTRCQILLLEKIKEKCNINQATKINE
jgi:hypothetical protein